MCPKSLSGNTVTELCESVILDSGIHQSLPFVLRIIGYGGEFRIHFGSSFGVRGCGRRQEVERWGGTHRDRASDQDGALGSNVRPGAVGHICLQHVLSTPHFRVNPRRGSTRLPEKTGTSAENRGGFFLRFYVGTTQWFSVVEWQGRDGRGRGTKQ